MAFPAPSNMASFWLALLAGLIMTHELLRAERADPLGVDELRGRSRPVRISRAVTVGQMLWCVSIVVLRAVIGDGVGGINITTVINLARPRP